MHITVTVKALENVPSQRLEGMPGPALVATHGYPPAVDNRTTYPVEIRALV